MVDYGKMYINLMENYRKVWWKLFNNSDCVRWNNILSLIEMLFTIPVSDGHLERCFSQMKVLKTDKRCSLSEKRLDKLLHIHLESPPLGQWDAKGAVQLWWQDKTRRPTRTTTPTCSSRQSSSITIVDSEDEEEDEEPQLNLEDWEQWLQSL